MRNNLKLLGVLLTCLALSAATAAPIGHVGLEKAPTVKTSLSVSK